MKWIGTDIEREIKDSMLRYVPYYYTDSYVVNNILDVDAAEMELYYDRIQDVLDQYFFSTATWGLERWEHLLALPSGGDNENEQSLIERRAAIQSTLLGYGVCTKAKLVEICAFYGGVQVIVHENPANYTISIEFVDTLGIPSNILTLQRIVRTAVPAHIAITYVYRYMTFAELNSYNITFGELDSMNINFLDFSKYTE